MSNEKNGADTAPGNSSKKSDILDFFSRFTGPLKVLIKMHVRLATKELKKDTNRFISGIVTLFLALFFLTCFAFVLHFVGYLLLIEFTTLTELYAVLIILGADLLLVLILFMITNSIFKKPFFSETKKVINETFKDLKQ
jgi:uncharacterized membrane protein YqjE